MGNAMTLEQHERRHWLGMIERVLEQNPDVLSLLYDRAAVLRSLGDFAGAEQAYRDLLAQDPGNFMGLIDLSCIFAHQGRNIEAFALRRELLRRYPSDATALAYYANMLVLGGDLTAAESHYRRALALAPHHTLVHQGLAEVLRQRGRLPESAWHAAAASPEQAMFPRQYRGEGPAIPLLLFVSEREQGESMYADRILDDSTFLVTKCIVERMPLDQPLPEHAILFNGIGDADRSPQALLRLQTLLARQSAPIVNPPELVLQTGRAAMAQRLANLPGVRVAKMLELSAAEARSDAALALIAARGLEWPLLVRIPDYHAGRYFEKAENAEHFRQIIASFPELVVLVMEYLDTRGTASSFHKMRVMVIDGLLYPTHLAYGSGWKLHYFSSDMMHDPALRAKEAAFLADPVSMLGPQAWQALQNIARSINLDYFGIDCALAPNGDVVVFECNVAMVVAKPGVQAQWSYRQSAYDVFQAAARGMLRQRAQLIS